MTRTTTLLMTVAFATVSQAQNWVVGEPVDMLLYSQPFYGGCTPGTDYTFTIPVSPVSGVDYTIRVLSSSPPGGTVDILPGLDDAGAGAVLLIDAAVQRNVTVASGTTSVTLEFKAVGTPTTAGQSHPCGASNFWISNLGICPEGLSPIIDDGCTVQLNTGINASGQGGMGIITPTASNGHRLQLPAQMAGVVQVMDALGRLASVPTATTSGGTSIDCSAWSAGTYTVVLTVPDGSVHTSRFQLVR